MTTYLNSFAPSSGAIPAQELVPSRYALRLGDIDVMVVSDGVLPLPTETWATGASFVPWMVTTTLLVVPSAVLIVTVSWTVWFAASAWTLAAPLFSVYFQPVPVCTKVP